jgi:succinate-acetate transporter protein
LNHPVQHSHTSHAAQDEAVRADDLTRIVLRPLATPLPLGALALAIGSILLTAIQLKWIAASNLPQVALVVLVLVVPLELLAATLAFAVRDVVMATGFGILTGAWAASGALLVSAKPGMLSPVFGVLAIAVAVTLLVPAITASFAKPAAAVLMTVAATRFALTGVYQLGAGDGWQTASGIVGILLVATAFYSGLALALEDARHHQVLPTSRRSTSAEAMSGELPDQLRALATEAGVRQES